MSDVANQWYAETITKQREEIAALQGTIRTLLAALELLVRITIDGQELLNTAQSVIDAALAGPDEGRA